MLLISGSWLKLAYITKRQWQRIYLNNPIYDIWVAKLYQTTENLTCKSKNHHRAQVSWSKPKSANQITLPFPSWWGRYIQMSVSFTPFFSMTLFLFPKNLQLQVNIVNSSKKEYFLLEKKEGIIFFWFLSNQTRL